MASPPSRRVEPPARLKEERRWGRQPRSRAQNGHSGGFSLQELSALSLCSWEGGHPLRLSARAAGTERLAGRKELARSPLAEERQTEAMCPDLEAEAQETSTDELLALDKSRRLPGPVPPPL